MFASVVVRGCWPVCTAYCSAGRPNASNAERVQDVVALHAAEPADHVGGDVAQRVADVQARARGVREHVHDEERRLRGVGVPALAVGEVARRVGGEERAAVRPLVLPAQLDLARELARCSGTGRRRSGRGGGVLRGHPVSLPTDGRPPARGRRRHGAHRQPWSRRGTHSHRPYDALAGRERAREWRPYAPDMSDSTPASAPGSSAADLAALRAAAAQAAAEAAEARAQAAAAALAAAQAAAAAGAPARRPRHRRRPPQLRPLPCPSTPRRSSPGTRSAVRCSRSARWSRTTSRSRQPSVGIPLAMMNRHGLVAGATGTGKTKTLQVLAEGLSAAGVPVFVADIKGDLSGLAVPGTPTRSCWRAPRASGRTGSPTASPVEFLSLGGLGTGIPVRTTVTDFGPLLLAKVLGLNDTQESSLGLIFHWADTQGLALLDLKDLQSTIALPRRATRARPSSRASAGCRRRPPGSSCARSSRCRRRAPTSSSASPRSTCRAAAHRARRPRRHQRARAARRAGPARAVLDVPHVAARRAVPGAARGGRPRQAAAGVLLRRGAPAVHRRVGKDFLTQVDADRAADPVQGRRRLLRHAEPQGRARPTCWASWATASSTPCAPSRPTTPTALRAAARTFPDLAVRPRAAAHSRWAPARPS